jgi:hypothetical protein
MSLPIPGLSGSSKAQKTETSSSSTTEEMHVNGRRVDVAEGEPREPREDDEGGLPKRKSRNDGDFGKTCKKNNQCEADACFVGNGELGYCTKFCNSWSDCPSHWECRKPGNAPQRICMQGS